LGAFLKTIKFDTYTNVGKKIMRLGDIWGPGVGSRTPTRGGVNRRFKN